MTAIVTRNYDRAREVLETNKGALTRIAEALLIREVFDADQVKQIARDFRSKTPWRPRRLKARLMTRPTIRTLVRRPPVPLLSLTGGLTSRIATPDTTIRALRTRSDMTQRSSAR
jgi:hypothetical protein